MQIKCRAMGKLPSHSNAKWGTQLARFNPLDSSPRIRGQDKWQLVIWAPNLNRPNANCFSRVLCNAFCRSRCLLGSDQPSNQSINQSASRAEQSWHSVTRSISQPASQSGLQLPMQCLIGRKRDSDCFCALLNGGRKNR